MLSSLSTILEISQVLFQSASRPARAKLRSTIYQATDRADRWVGASQVSELLIEYVIGAFRVRKKSSSETPFMPA